VGGSVRGDLSWRDHRKLQLLRTSGVVHIPVAAKGQSRKWINNWWNVLRLCEAVEHNQRGSAQSFSVAYRDVLSGLKWLGRKTDRTSSSYTEVCWYAHIWWCCVQAEALYDIWCFKEQDRQCTRWFKYDRDNLCVSQVTVCPGHIWTTLYIQHNIKAHSRNHCCRGKVITIAYSEYVRVALVIQYETL
jgi:hypothetical protein